MAQEPLPVWLGRRAGRRRLLTVFGLSALAAAAGCSEAESEPWVGAEASELYDSKRCRSCHASHYDEWSASMHAYAAEDPVFLAMNRRGQEETQGALGSFCVNCHAPLAVRTGSTIDGLDLDVVPAELKGVTCYFCHNAEAVDAEHNNPVRLRGDVTMQGRIRDPVENSTHRAAHSPLLDGSDPASAKLCGSCHDLALPPELLPEGAEPVLLERTFAEWKASLFSPENSPTPSAFSTCGSCHMPVVDSSRPIGPGGPARERHSHHFAAVDAPLGPFPNTGDAERDGELRAAQAAEQARVLDPTLRVEICVQAWSDEAAAVRVTLDNAAAGHNFPSGAAQDRRAFVEVIAYRGENVLYESGVVGAGEDVTRSDDADLWLFRDVTLDASGEPAHMFWDVASISPRTIPAQVTADPNDPRYYQSHAVRRFPLAPGEFVAGVPDRVTVRVRIVPVGLDVLSDLVASGHLDERVLASMTTFDLLPHRRLAAPAGSPLARLRTVSMEYSAATLASPLFSTHEDFTETPPLRCVGMPR